MITADLVRIFAIANDGSSRVCIPESLDELARDYCAVPREAGEAVVDDWNRTSKGPSKLLAQPFGSCRCCGEPVMSPPGDQCRCERHSARNPCAVEGCKRTTAASKEFRNDLWLCGTHWRLACPPRSMRRRAYHAFFRKAKRDGWTDDLNRQFWRYWFRLVRTARQRANEGFLDMAMLERLFG